jgi:hypothetical protein
VAVNGKNLTHSAEAAALGFYYQSFFALLTLLEQNTDDAAVAIERLDDIELDANGQKLLYQLKHSIQNQPPVISIKSRALWRTIKVWIDILPSLSLSETTLHLVAVADIAEDDPLQSLTKPNTDREKLVEAMLTEAQRVADAREVAAKTNKKKQLPYEDRIDGCAAFLSLSKMDQLNLLRRVVIQQDSPKVDEIEDLIANHQNLKILPSEQRPKVANRLVEWWDRQIIYSLCGQRDRAVTRIELQQQISIFVADIEQGKLAADFEIVNPPGDYQPDSMLTRQINLVEGKRLDLSKAIREEWRAREHRSKWLTDNPAMKVTIHEYDCVLKEHWSDRHDQMAEECAELEDIIKRESGLKLLRWTHDEAPNVVRPIFNDWDAAYYVRGSYQILAINLTVGWHPDYTTLLGDDE